MSSPKTVLLYSPHFVASYRLQPLYRATPPLSHLALARCATRAEVEIIDAKWDFDWRGEFANVGRLLCAGVTSLTGPAERRLEFAALVREVRPDLPIIWGGWHASFAAQQAMEDPRVDVVVRGMGERTFVDVVRAIEAGGSGGDCRHSLSRRRKISSTPDRPLEDITIRPRL
jgi:hypothetical protein